MTPPRIYLDSNVVILATERDGPYQGELKALFSRVEIGSLDVVVSEISLAEVLVHPLMSGNEALIETYRTILDPDGDIEVVPVTRNVLEQAARLRAFSSLKLADAIHLATALSSRCDTMLTADERLGRKVVPPMLWLTPADLAGSGLT